MPVTYGFFNSKNGDRTYNAEEMGSLFGGIITDGVFANYPNTGDQLVVAPVSGMQIKVGPGRGWFHNTWINNDDVLEADDNLFTCPAASSVYERIDTIFIKVDTRNEGRRSSFVLESGEPDAQPWEHIATHNAEDPEGVYWYRLADITIHVGATTISSSDIVNRVGGFSDNAPPIITAPLEHVSAAGVLAGWKEEVDAVVEAEVQAALNDPTSVLATSLTAIPGIWLCDMNMPVRRSDTAVITQTSHAHFAPDFTDSLIGSKLLPKTGDIVIGRNGYYARISSASIGNAAYQIRLTGRGHSILETVNDYIASFNKQLNTTVWMCSGDIPATAGRLVTYVKNTSGGIPAQATFYPDFSTNPTIQENNAPKVGDCVLGSNGYYGVITNAVVSGSSYFSITIAGTGTGLINVGVEESVKVLEITFSGIDPYDTSNSGTWYYPDVSMYPSWPAIREAYNDGYTLVAKILVEASQHHSGGASVDEDIYAYVPITKTLWDGHLAGIEVHTINYWGQTHNIDAIHYKWTTDDTLIGWYDHLYYSVNLTPVINSIPESCEFDSETGAVKFKNRNGAILFTFQLPVYSGTVENSDSDQAR